MNDTVEDTAYTREGVNVRRVVKHGIWCTVVHSSRPGKSIYTKVLGPYTQIYLLHVGTKEVPLSD